MKFHSHLHRIVTFGILLVFPVIITLGQRHVKSGGIIYVDINISQPNLEDCYELSSMDPVIEKDWFMVFPNPGRGLYKLTIDQQHYPGSLNIWVYDITGKPILHFAETMTGNSFVKEIDISSFAKGMYFIRVTGKDRVGFKQIIYQ